MNLVTNASEVPNYPHYAILVYRTKVIQEPNTKELSCSGGYETLFTVDHYVSSNYKDWVNKAKELDKSKVPLSYVCLRVESKAEPSVEFKLR